MNIVRMNTVARALATSRKTTAGTLFLVCAALAWGRGAAAQATPSDSLLDRLRRAEAAIRSLQTQLAEQEETAVRSRSGVHMELNGRVMVGGFGNSRRVNNVDDPQFVLPDTVAGVPVRGVGMSIRQTRLGLTVRSTSMLRGAFTGDVDVDFYGGQLPSSGGRTFPLVRMRTARAMLRWPHAQLLIGQESPLVSGVNPVTPAAIGTPDFAGAGNLWLWLPQARVGIESSGPVRVGVATAVLAPTSGDAASPFDTQYDLAERSQRPYLQGRAHVAWDVAEQRAEIGCGVHQGWLVPSTTRVSSNAVACDAIVPVLPALEIRGEFFRGQALRGLGGGGIGQNFSAASAPLTTTGGWLQLNARPTAAIQTGVGCGADHPERGMLRRRNDACATYLTLRHAGPLFWGAEFRRLRTEYTSGRFTNDHVTLAAGFEF